jgi:hypothetical protein
MFGPRYDQSQVGDLKKNKRVLVRSGQAILIGHVAGKGDGYIDIIPEADNFYVVVDKEVLMKGSTSAISPESMHGDAVRMPFDDPFFVIRKSKDIEDEWLKWEIHDSLTMIQMCRLVKLQKQAFLQKVQDLSGMDDAACQRVDEVMFCVFVADLLKGEKYMDEVYSKLTAEPRAGDASLDDLFFQLLGEPRVLVGGKTWPSARAVLKVTAAAVAAAAAIAHGNPSHTLDSTPSPQQTPSTGLVIPYEPADLSDQILSTHSKIQLGKIENSTREFAFDDSAFKMQAKRAISILESCRYQILGIHDKKSMKNAGCWSVLEPLARASIHGMTAKHRSLQVHAVIFPPEEAITLPVALEALKHDTAGPLIMFALYTSGYRQIEAEDIQSEMKKMKIGEKEAAGHWLAQLQNAITNENAVSKTLMKYLNRARKLAKKEADNISKDLYIVFLNEDGNVKKEKFLRNVDRLRSWATSFTIGLHGMSGTGGPHETTLLGGNLSILAYAKDDQFNLDNVESFKGHLKRMAMDSFPNIIDGYRSILFHNQMLTYLPTEMNEVDIIDTQLKFTEFRARYVNNIIQKLHAVDGSSIWFSETADFSILTITPKPKQADPRCPKWRWWQSQNAWDFVLLNIFMGFSDSYSWMRLVFFRPAAREHENYGQNKFANLAITVAKSSWKNVSALTFIAEAVFSAKEYMPTAMKAYYTVFAQVDPGVRAAMTSLDRNPFTVRMLEFWYSKKRINEFELCKYDNAKMQAWESWGWGMKIRLGTMAIVCYQAYFFPRRSSTAAPLATSKENPALKAHPTGGSQDESTVTYEIQQSLGLEVNSAIQNTNHDAQALCVGILRRTAQRGEVVTEKDLNMLKKAFGMDRTHEGQRNGGMQTFAVARPASSTSSTLLSHPPRSASWHNFLRR